MKKYSKELKSAALISAALIFIGSITAFVYSQVSDFWGDGSSEDTPSGLEFLEKNKERFVKRKELIDIMNVNAGTSADLTSVYFSDKLHGISCGEKGTVLLASAGGLEWRPIHGIDPLSNFTDCYISIDEKFFIIDEDGNLYNSSDLGKTWAVKKLGGSFAPLRIKFFEDSVGFITGSNGTILKSIDKGQTWKRTAVPAKSIIYDLDFRDEKNGMAVGTAGEFLTTSDGGNNWIRPKKFSGEYLKRIKYISGANWIAAGAEGNVYISPSNGKSWEKKDVPEGEGFRSIIFLNDERGIIADSKGSIYITKDAGDKWKRLAFIEGMKINQIVSISKNELIAVGDGGLIKRIIIK